MRLKRQYMDFRVTEQVAEEQLLGDGPYTVYRVTKRGLTSFEAVDLLAKSAGVEREDIALAGLKDKDGVTGQLMTVLGGRRVDIKERAITIRPIGRAARPIESTDSTGNSFEIVVRDLSGDDMRRIRINLSEVKEIGLPNYFDDQRFGCLRHGQGFIVRSLLAGKAEDALRALLAAPSKYGAEKVEMFKHGIQQRWGDWKELAAYCRGRRGATVFEHLVENPGDFQGALERGVATRERTIHLFAWQSYLWNRAAGLILRDIVGADELSWLPGDAGSLPVARTLTDAQRAELEAARLPLLGPDAELDDRARAAYETVFRGEGVSIEDFLALDISGFRPQAEERPLLVKPQYLRAAPAEQDEIYRKRQKMRLRFTLPRGHYATLVCKRLMMPTEKDSRPLRMWISRHPLDWPNDDGSPRLSDDSDRRHHSESGKPRQSVGEYRARRDDRGGGSSPWSGKRDDRSDRGDRSWRSPKPSGDGPPTSFRDLAAQVGSGGGDRRDDYRDDRRDNYRDDRRDRSERPSSPWGNRQERSPYGGGDDRGSSYRDRGASDSPYGSRGGRSGGSSRPNRGKPEGWPAGVPWNDGSSGDRD